MHDEGYWISMSKKETILRICHALLDFFVRLNAYSYHFCE